MSTLRRILGAPFLAGTFAVALVYALLLQGLLSAASGAASAADPQTVFIICSGGKPASPYGTDPAEAPQPHDCCALLCKLASVQAAAITATDVGAIFAPRRMAATLAGPLRGDNRAAPAYTLAEARAPPVCAV